LEEDRTFIATTETKEKARKTKAGRQENDDSHFLYPSYWLSMEGITTVFGSTKYCA
jgi:hypothetical protein